MLCEGVLMFSHRPMSNFHGIISRVKTNFIIFYFPLVSGSYWCKASHQMLTVVNKMFNTLFTFFVTVLQASFRHSM